MKKYQHHPDGWLIIGNEGSVYMDTPANIELDCGMQCPALPGGAVSVLYIEGRHNAAFDAEGNQYGGEDALIPHYDALINTVDALLAAKEQREAEAAAAAELAAQEAAAAAEAAAASA